MTSGTKAFLIILALLATILILAQLVMGLLLASGGQVNPGLRKSHQHTGYTTVVIVLAYVALSLRVLLGIRARDAA